MCRNLSCQGPFDNVVIDMAYQAINHAAANYNLISNLTVSGQSVTLDLSGGTLDLSGGGGQGIFQVDQNGDVVKLQDRFKSAVVTSGTTLTATSADSVLDNVQLNGTLDMTRYNDAYAQFFDAVTINGTVLLGGDANYASLYFGYQNDAFGMTVAGTGTIQFGQAYNYTDDLYNLSAGTLTFATGITIQGGHNSSILFYYTTSGPIDNQGTIEQSTNGGQLTISLAGWVNDGAILVGNKATATLDGRGWTNSSSGKITATNATLNLYGNWTNQGTITVDPSTLGLGNPSNVDPSDHSAPNYNWSNQGAFLIAAGSTVNLGGIFTTDAFNSLVASDLTGPTPLYLTGVLDNSPADNPVSGGVLALDAATGPLNLWRRVLPARLTTSGDDDLVATSAGGTLNGVTLDGTLDMPQYQSNSGDDVAYVVNGLTLNGTIELGEDGPADLFFGAAGDNVARDDRWHGRHPVQPLWFPGDLVQRQQRNAHHWARHHDLWRLGQLDYGHDGGHRQRGDYRRNHQPHRLRRTDNRRPRLGQQRCY